MKFAVQVTVSSCGQIHLGVRERSKRKGEEGKIKCLILSQAHSCSSEQQDLQVFPLSVPDFQSKTHHDISHAQRSPLADLHRQATTRQPQLPFLKTGEISALQGRI